ncbi:MAG: RidA family protein [Parvularculaceae bacterium]|nr:RidA family protein [Parvularculaceae bacterium]
MATTKINPSELYDSVRYGFSHAVKGGGGELIHCAGQLAWDKDYNLIGAGDIGAQARQCLKNLKAALAAAGAGPENVVRIRTYVVGHKPEYLEPVSTALAEFYGGGEPAPNTWIGVQTLVMPEFLIEIEATAEI